MRIQKVLLKSIGIKILNLQFKKLKNCGKEKNKRND